MCLHGFSPLFSKVFFFKLLSIENSLQLLNMSLLLELWFPDIFRQPVVCLFSFLIENFTDQVFNFEEVQPIDIFL